MEDWLDASQLARQHLRQLPPFYTGEQRSIIDTEGQVDRFMKRLQTSQERQAREAERRAAKNAPKPKKKSLLEEIYGEEAAAEATSDAG